MSGVSATKETPGGRATKACPSCAETVLEAAVACRYCGYEFPLPPPPPMSEERLATFEAAIERGERLSEHERDELLAEITRIAHHDNVLQLQVLQDAKRAEADRLGRELTPDEITELEARPALIDARNKLKANHERFRRLSAVFDKSIFGNPRGGSRPPAKRSNRRGASMRSRCSPSSSGLSSHCPQAGATIG